MFLRLRCGLLADIYVQAAFRRRGLGRQLVERLTLWFVRATSGILNGTSALEITGRWLSGKRSRRNHYVANAGIYPRMNDDRIALFEGTAI